MFITLEGIEGSGKTTQLDNIIKFMSDRHYEYVVTREPGGTEIGKKIRAILLSPDTKNLNSLTELLLYAADRAQHVKEVIIPSLESGKTVICDRFFDATTAYQGFARGLDMEQIKKLNEIILGSLKPDITLLFDLPPETGLKRAWTQINSGGRSESETRFEKEMISFHEKVRKGYLKIAKTEHERFHVIDASKNVNQVKKAIIDILSDKMP